MFTFTYRDLAGIFIQNYNTVKTLLRIRLVHRKLAQADGISRVVQSRWIEVFNKFPALPRACLVLSWRG